MPTLNVCLIQSTNIQSDIQGDKCINILENIVISQTMLFYMNIKVLICAFAAMFLVCWFRLVSTWAMLDIILNCQCLNKISNPSRISYNLDKCHYCNAFTHHVAKNGKYILYYKVMVITAHAQKIHKLCQQTCQIILLSWSHFLVS